MAPARLIMSLDVCLNIRHDPAQRFHDTKGGIDGTFLLIDQALVSKIFCAEKSDYECACN